MALPWLLLILAGTDVLTAVARADVILKSSGTTSSVSISPLQSKITTAIEGSTGRVGVIDPLAKLVWDDLCSASVTITDSITFPCGYDATVHYYLPYGITDDNGRTGDFTVTMPAAALTISGDSCGSPHDFFIVAAIAGIPCTSTTGLAYTIISSAPAHTGASTLTQLDILARSDAATQFLLSDESVSNVNAAVVTGSTGGVAIMDPVAKLIWDPDCSSTFQPAVAVTPPCGQDLVIYTYSSSGVSSSGYRNQVESFSADFLAGFCGQEIPYTPYFVLDTSAACTSTTGVAYAIATVARPPGAQAVATRSWSYSVIRTPSSSTPLTRKIVAGSTGAVGALDSNAKLIWDSSCSSEITIENLVNIPCGYDYTVVVHMTGSVKWGPYSGDQTLTFMAENLFDICGTNQNDLGSPRTFAFTFTADPACDATTGVAFVGMHSGPVITYCPEGCPASCIPGAPICTTCLQQSYRVRLPDANSQCPPCFDGFYVDPVTDSCKQSPMDLYCRTCTFDMTALAPKCASCFCRQHRILNPDSSTCDCDSTHHQDGVKAYCSVGAPV